MTTGVHSPVLLPSRFLLGETQQLPLGVTDREAYDELIANYAALKAKVNTALMAQVDNIRHRPVVDLSRNYIGATGLQAITSLLAKNDKLQELRLPGSGLNNDSVVFFCRAMTKHTRLARLDLSYNTISLAAGLALLSLLQQNHNVVHVNLSGTQVPHAVMKKIEEHLEQKNVSENCAVAACLNVESSALPEARSTRDMFPSSFREMVCKSGWAHQEQEALERLEVITQSAVTSLNAEHTFLPSPHPDSGWRLIEVAVLAPPFLFVSEMELLVRQVFPRLNEELVSRKVHLLTSHDPPDGPAGTNLRHLRFAIAADAMRNIEKSRVLTIELIGDRAGDYEQLPANELLKRPQLLGSLRKADSFVSSVHADSARAPPLRPILKMMHERAMTVSKWIIIATRIDTRRMGVPPSLTPLLTEEPSLEHPDYLQLKVQRTVTVDSETVYGSQQIQCDSAVKEKKWREHQMFRDEVLNTAPVQELVIRNYKANFDKCSKDGQIHFKDLEEFAEAVYRRMRLILFAQFPPCNDSHPSVYQSHNMNEFATGKLKLYQERLHTFLLHLVDRALSKKSITNRLGLYVVTPPSRNVFVLHGSEPLALTALTGAFTLDLISKDVQKYRIAFHTTRSPLLTEEPTELREIMCNIILQLCPEQEVYRQAIAEVDVFRLQKLFSDILSGKTKMSDPFTKVENNTSEQTTTVVIIDGLDHVLPIVTPCTALRVCEETGKDIWDTSPPQENNNFSYIPRCLSRNVRLVLGCESGSEMQREFESRGRDSAELFSLGPITPNDFDEMLSSDVIKKAGVEVSDDDFVLIRKKEEALSPEYITFVVDVLRSFNESPGLEPQSVMKSLPGTVREMVCWVYNNVRKCFSVAHIRTFSRLLMCSRWGVYESQLRVMLQLPQRRFNQLLRMMRPLLEHRMPSSLGIEGGNALYVRISIRSRVFSQLLALEDLQMEGGENDTSVWHGMLANCYLNVLNNVIGQETALPIFSLNSKSPYERMAVKELPYHAAQAGAWHILFRSVLTMPFLMIVYRNTLGYHLVRDLISAFNILYELYELGEYAYEEGTESGQKPSSLMRLRDYIYFLRHYNARLTEFPHLVLQTAVESSAKYNFVGSDAREYIRLKINFNAPIARRRITFFEILRNTKPNIHCAAITACRFEPKGRRITTGGIDRSVCTVNPETGAIFLQTRHALTAVEEILYSETGAYHAAVSHDRSILVYDNANMRMVSRCDGGTFDAPLASVAFSARGRFYLVATEDLHLRVFETEKSLLLLHVDQRKFMFDNVDGKNINLIRGHTFLMPHRVEDEVFYATCHNVLTVWKLTATRDEFLQETRFEVSFTVGSGKALLAGTHLLLHPAQFPAPPDGRRPPPRLLHLCNLATQREVAVLTSSCSQLFFQLSVNENLVASGLEDGSVVVHQLPWIRLLQEEEEEDIIAIPPVMELQAYRESPVASVKALHFRGDDKGLFALGNSCEIKYWALPRRVTDVDNNNTADTEADVPMGVDDCSKEKELRSKDEEGELVEGVADGEFVLDVADVTSWDVVQVENPKGAEVVIGDSSGRLTLLRLWSPLM